MELPKIFFIDLDVYQKNCTEEQNHKESLQAISSVIQVSLKGLASFYVWPDVDTCSLMHIRNNRVFNSPNVLQPMVVKVNGTTIMIITPWDALNYFYTINFPPPKKDPKTKKMKFTYLSQVKFLFRYLDQICRWITIIGNCRSHPTMINVSWKSNQEKIIAIAFGVAILAPTEERKKQLASIWREDDQHLFPRE